MLPPRSARGRGGCCPPPVQGKALRHRGVKRLLGPRPERSGWRREPSPGTSAARASGFPGRKPRRARELAPARRPRGRPAAPPPRPVGRGPVTGDPSRTCWPGPSGRGGGVGCDGARWVSSVPRPRQIAPHLLPSWGPQRLTWILSASLAGDGVGVGGQWGGPQFSWVGCVRLQGPPLLPGHRVPQLQLLSPARPAQRHSTPESLPVVSAVTPEERGVFPVRPLTPLGCQWGVPAGVTVVSHPVVINQGLKTMEGRSVDARDTQCPVADGGTFKRCPRRGTVGCESCGSYPLAVLAPRP